MLSVSVYPFIVFITHHRFRVTFFFSLDFDFFYSAENKLTPLSTLIVIIVENVTYRRAKEKSKYPLCDHGRKRDIFSLFFILLIKKRASPHYLLFFIKPTLIYKSSIQFSLYRYRMGWLSRECVGSGVFGPGSPYHTSALGK